jgi:hypothetical protein
MTLPYENVAGLGVWNRNRIAKICDNVVVDKEQAIHQGCIVFG